jgi:predicted PurR-regulated permease PerM
MIRLLLRRWKPALAAAVLMLLSLVIIMIPIWALINMVSSKVSYAVDHSNELSSAVKTIVKRIQDQTGLQIMGTNSISKYGGMLAEKLPSILGATFNTVTLIALMYFILFFMLVDGRRMERGLYNFIPVDDDNTGMIAKEVNSMVISNSIGIPLIAFLQGVVGLVGYLILGVREPLLWFMITCITAMLPIVGAAFAYVPLAIIFFAQGSSLKGIAMLGYGFGVIGLVDNFFRFWLQKKIADVHPLITVFGVLVGVSLFGFVGLIFGPLLISLFLLLMKIYTLEFTSKVDKD